MKIIKTSFFFFFLFFSALISCKKKDNDIIIEGKYKPSSVTNIDEVVMYSHQGQVRQEAVIRSFLTRKKLAENFILDKKTEVTHDFTSTYVFDFSNNGTVNTSVRDLLTPSKAEIIARTSEYVDIAAIDSITTSFYRDNSRCQTLQSNIINPIPQKKEYYLPSTSGFSSFYKFRPMMRLEIINGQLYLPILSHATSYISVGGTQCLYYASGSHATFNKNVLVQLKPGDTILYQAKRIMLIKQ